MTAWRDEDTLRELYVDEKLSLKDCADRLGCSKDTIWTWLKKFGIDRRSANAHQRLTPAFHGYDKDGYEIVKSGKGESAVPVHQLIVIAHGADPHKVFSPEYNVHHESGVPWDNRPDNLHLMKHGRHRSLHEGTLDAPWKDESVLRYKYHNEGKSLRELADEFGVANTTILDWMDKFGIDRREAWAWNQSD